MPNATAQLMIGPLLVRGIFFFSRGVGKDVFWYFFGPENILQRQAEAEIRER
jgi:hypothetical protein